MSILETIIVVLIIATTGAFVAWYSIKKGKDGGCGGGCTCGKLGKLKDLDKNCQK